MKKFFLTLIAFILFVFVSAEAKGYVSRDCPWAGAKESITWNSNFSSSWFYTYSGHLRKRPAGKWKWEWHNSGRTWEKTWRSYAGQVGSFLKNYYYSGVYGIHYYWNTRTRKTERRAKLVRDCNLMNWGLSNW